MTIGNGLEQIRILPLNCSLQCFVVVQIWILSVIHVWREKSIEGFAQWAMLGSIHVEHQIKIHFRPSATLSLPQPSCLL